MDAITIFNSQQDYMILFLRLIIGIIMFPHGAQKLFGWFGGGGLKDTIQHMSSAGVPRFVSLLIIFGQSLGSIAIIIGFCTRLVAVCLFIIMAGAMIINMPNGWMMNWTGKKNGEGIEYFILFLAIDLYIIISGSGPLGFDNLIYSKF